MCLRCKIFKPFESNCYICNYFYFNFASSKITSVCYWLDHCSNFRSPKEYLIVLYFLK